MKYGIWIEQPGRWMGWFGSALGNTSTPMTYGEDEVQGEVERFKSIFPDAQLIEARAQPPAEMTWNEEVLAEMLRVESKG